MEQQRHRSGAGRRRRRKQRSSEQRAPVEPILIAARRPNSPLVARAPAAISAAPKPPKGSEGRKLAEAEAKPARVEPEAAPRRAARIVQIPRADADEQERQRLRLLDRLMAAETRGAISRTANEYAEAGFVFPEEQPVQLQLLEHFDEERARVAIETLGRLIAEQPPFKRPLLEQRLRRLEEYADEPLTRDAAAELRRAIRV